MDNDKLKTWKDSALKGKIINLYPKDLLALIELAERATQPAQDRCCEHDSDCAVHNAPALPVGPCDCTLSEKPAQEQVAAVRAVPEVKEWIDRVCQQVRDDLLERSRTGVDEKFYTFTLNEMTHLIPMLAALPKKVRVPNNGYSALTKRWAEGWNDCVDAINTVPPQSDTSGLRG